MNNRADALLLHVDNKVGVLGSLVGVVDAGEALNLTRAGGLVDATAVSLLAVLNGGGDVDEEEGTSLLNKLTGRLASSLEGSNRSSNNSGTSAGKLRSNKGNTANVNVAVRLAEAKLSRQLRTDSLAEEHGDGAAATLVEGGLEGAGNLLLAAVGQTSHEDGEALFLGQRVLLAQDLDDLGV